MTTEITTKSGFRCTVDEDAMDDMELLTDLTALDKGDTTALPSVIDRLLGSEGRAALYEHIRTSSGRVPITKAVEVLSGIIEGLKDTRSKK